jgi:hypothetical protein
MEQHVNAHHGIVPDNDKALLSPFRPWLVNVKVPHAPTDVPLLIGWRGTEIWLQQSVLLGQCRKLGQTVASLAINGHKSLTASGS